MKLIKVIVGAAAALSFVPGAMAQDPAPPTAPAAAATAGPYSDDDVQKYAVALVAVNKVQTDAGITDADKPAKMAAAVNQSGVDIVKFNAMTQAMQADKALAARIQTAAAAVPR